MLKAFKYRIYPSNSQKAELAQAFGNANCHKINTELNLSIREWECKYCHTQHDRDINAARNVLRIGQELPEYQKALREKKVKTLREKKVKTLREKEFKTSFSEMGSCCL